MYGFVMFCQFWLKFTLWSCHQQTPSISKHVPPASNISNQSWYSWEPRNPEALEPGYIWFCWNQLNMLKVLARCDTLRIDVAYTRIRHSSFLPTQEAVHHNLWGLVLVTLCVGVRPIYDNVHKFHKWQRNLWSQQVRLWSVQDQDFDNGLVHVVISMQSCKHKMCRTNLASVYCAGFTCKLIHEEFCRHAPYDVTKVRCNSL